MTVILRSIAIAGYRSFGANVQRLPRLRKLNILIGQNNSGKSNIVRFLYEVAQHVSDQPRLALEPLATHLPSGPPLSIGVALEVARDDAGTPRLHEDHPALKRINSATERDRAALALGKVLDAKAELDGTPDCWSIVDLQSRADTQGSWVDAMKPLPDYEIQHVWKLLTNQGGGSRKQYWEPELVRALALPLPSFRAEMIPAIRRIGEKGTTSEGFDGTGLIDRLARLQNPGAGEQDARSRFNAIRHFLREVVSRPDAEIEIPYERNTINIHMDGKILPVESLGSGIHEVLILAAAATLLEGHVVCMEEPELHLNPLLQKKLARYLINQTKNQYFITTHSAALMDTPDAEIYHVTLVGGASVVERVTSDSARSRVCEDLGYHPSDLLQANCLIWVEGPSDRIYLNWWLRAVDSTLVEGLHYSIMFYGGRLASHLTNSEDAIRASNAVDDFISLRRLNRRGVMILDSDRRSESDFINSTKCRLQREFDAGPGHAWITDGREIENYLESSQLGAAIESVHPGVAWKAPRNKFGDALTLRSKAGKVQKAKKIEIARCLAENGSPNLDVLDLRPRLEALRDFIRKSNPPAHIAD